MPSAVTAMPASARMPDTQARTIMPVMMVAEASTNADLEGGGGEFEMVVFCRRLVRAHVRHVGALG